MKIIHKNIKHGEVKVNVENNDDLWFLSNIIEQGDFVSGKTLRKIKVGSAEKEVVRKPMFMKLEVEKVEFSKTTNVLRAAGKIIEGPDNVSKGSYHTFNIEPGTKITIIKKKWFSYQLDRLKEAEKSKIPKIIICIFDREEVFFAKMQRSGYNVLANIKGEVTKKAVEIKPKKDFYAEIIKKLEEYDKRFNVDKIILASPAFWKEELLKILKNQNLKKKIIQATCSSVNESAINEVLKRKEVAQALAEQRISTEIKAVETLLTEISKQEKAVYGIKETEKAAEMGAVELLLLSDSLIKKTRQKGTFEKINRIMQNTEKSKGKIMIISSEHEGGKKLNGLGSIGAILRFKLSY